MLVMRVTLTSNTYTWTHMHQTSDSLIAFHMFSCVHVRLMRFPPISASVFLPRV